MPALPPPVSLAPALAPCRSCGRVFPAERLQCPHDGQLLPLEGRLLDGKFRLDRKIGDGGMASVWQATNTFVHRAVAIKLMHARFASDAELLGRFRNEASAAGRIGSPHICDVLDFGTSEIGPYIVLELLEGASLAELIQTHRRLDPGLAVWIVHQALDGLGAAHKAGIVHRDLKPENIYLCRAIRGQWVVKLMDFGISKFAHHFLTAAGATMGTPHYMAPEQVQGASRVDARADLWSIGVILYEAITGVQLFARQNVADALVALRSYQPPPLAQYVPDAPRGLSEVLQRCLQREPKNRYASAQALAADLAPFERAGPPPEIQRAAAGAPVSKDSKPSTPAKPGAPGPAAVVKPGAPAAAAKPAGPGAAPKVTGAQAVVAKPGGPAGANVAGAAVNVAGAGPQAVARPGGPQAAVKPGGPQAAVKPGGPQAAVKPGGPQAAAVGPKVTGPQAAVARPGGPAAAVKVTGPQAAVARPGGPAAPVKPGGPQAAGPKVTGPQPVVGKPGAPASRPAGPQAVAAQAAGPRGHVPVPKNMNHGPGASELDGLPTKPMQRPMAAAASAPARRPVAEAPWYKQTWLWGLWFGLLGGLLVLLAVLMR